MLWNGYLVDDTATGARQRRYNDERLVARLDRHGNHVIAQDESRNLDQLAHRQGRREAHLHEHHALLGRHVSNGKEPTRGAAVEELRDSVVWYISLIISKATIVVKPLPMESFAAGDERAGISVIYDTKCREKASCRASIKPLFGFIRDE